MSTLYDVLVELAPEHDGEILEGYRRYDTQLERVATPAELNAYADYIRQEGELRIFSELSASERAQLPAPVQTIADAVVDDIDLSMENRRVVALLNQRGEHEVAPDLGNH